MYEELRNNVTIFCPKIASASDIWKNQGYELVTFCITLRTAQFLFSSITMLASGSKTIHLPRLCIELLKVN